MENKNIAKKDPYILSDLDPEFTDSTRSYLYRPKANNVGPTILLVVLALITGAVGMYKLNKYIPAITSYLNIGVQENFQQPNQSNDLYKRLSLLEQHQLNIDQKKEIDRQVQITAEKIASQFGGGQNIKGETLTDKSWSCKNGKCTAHMRASWNGVWVSSNYYWFEGILDLDENGHGHFTETSRTAELGFNPNVELR